MQIFWRDVSCIVRPERIYAVLLMFACKKSTSKAEVMRVMWFKSGFKWPKDAKSKFSMVLSALGR